MYHQAEEVEWTTKISVKAQHYTVGILTGFNFAAGFTLTEPSPHNRFCNPVNAKCCNILYFHIFCLN
jgi:hypothetical protein